MHGFKGSVPVKGVRYMLADAKCEGWRVGNKAGAHSAKHWRECFTTVGVYLGPDRDGMEPIMSFR